MKTLDMLIFNDRNDLCSTEIAKIRTVFDRLDNIPLTKKNILKYVRFYHSFNKRQKFFYTIYKLIKYYYKREILAWEFEEKVTFSSEFCWFKSIRKQWKIFEKIMEEML